ncbi:hypothetical protein SK128_011535 [Halocaridina rubra]|uniref:Uncharacterized protein n=1 Tax=Halocaridina rubra TaxID=373956 RepID=A0AAN8WIZ9_HALRR
MNEQAVCEPYVSSSVNESEETLYLSQEYKGYSSYHMEPTTVYSEEVLPNRETKVLPGEVSSCNYHCSYADQDTWQQEYQEVPLHGREQRDIKPNIIIKEEETDPYEKGQLTPSQPPQHQQSRLEGHEDLRTGVIRCVDSSMPPPDGVCYDPRSRRPLNKGFARPKERMRGSGDIFKVSGNKNKEMHQTHNPLPPPPPPPPLPRADRNSPPDLAHHSNTGSDSSSPSPSSVPSPNGCGRQKSTGKKERKKEDAEDVSSSIPDLDIQDIYSDYKK